LYVNFKHGQEGCISLVGKIVERKATEVQTSLCRDYFPPLIHVGMLKDGCI